jgi:hypothetical protein
MFARLAGVTLDGLRPTRDATSNLVFCQPRKAVGAPLFAPNAVMDEKEAVRVECLFDGEQPWIVWPPIACRLITLEEAAFRHVRSCMRGNAF